LSRCLRRHLILGNGGFSELSLYGRWRTDERSYVAAVRRYATEIGNLAWAAPQDWMTETHVLARTCLSARIHQRRTVGKVTNYLRLRDLAPELPIIAVLQGHSVVDFHRCADLYERLGVDLAALPLLGVGSICRRQHSAEVEHILRSLAAHGYRLHAFGAKVLGLGRYADAISSSDSVAWSYRGRFVPGCTPSHRSESNCLRFALAWHSKLLASLRAEGAGDSDCRSPRGRSVSLPLHATVAGIRRNTHDPARSVGPAPRDPLQAARDERRTHPASRTRGWTSPANRTRQGAADREPSH
jgi:hypothetical protein